MLEHTDRAITNGQSRETANIGYTRRRKTKQKHNTICGGHLHTQTNTKHVNKQLEVTINRTSLLCGKTDITTVPKTNQKFLHFLKNYFCARSFLSFL
jgi:hypothetical protein